MVEQAIEINRLRSPPPCGAARSAGRGSPLHSLAAAPMRHRIAALAIVCLPVSGCDGDARRLKSEFLNNSLQIEFLPGGDNCLVLQERLKCDDVAAFLRDKKRINADQKMAVVITDEAATAAQLTRLLGQLKSTGFSNIGRVKIVFRTEPDRKRDNS
jgi:hypothetical protein